MVLKVVKNNGLPLTGREEDAKQYVQDTVDRDDIEGVIGLFRITELPVWAKEL